MSIDFDIVVLKGGEKYEDSLRGLEPRTRFGIEKALWRLGKDIHTEFRKQVIAKDKTGRIYVFRTKSGARRRHRASAPGETPANRTGLYRKKFNFNVARADLLEVTDDAPYAGYLEEGTRIMKRRPGLGNAVKATQRDGLRNLSNSVRDSI